jgi:hypothetical protein
VWQLADKPEGPFTPEANPIKGSYSIDPAVLDDGNDNFYIYFGGLWGGQLQRYRNNKAIECGHEPADNEPALTARVARLETICWNLTKNPAKIVILDENGKPITAGDHDRRYFEGPWMHKYNGKYYFSYSTGNTHFLVLRNRRQSHTDPSPIRVKYLTPGGRLDYAPFHL